MSERLFQSIQNYLNAPCFHSFPFVSFPLPCKQSPPKTPPSSPQPLQQHHPTSPLPPSPTPFSGPFSRNQPPAQ
ncbi:hypothetical protein EX30DRAFT_32658 [Ascodesmis nigricans]|uniref:Uncharacterized protein n=1 Tax=Ascodesmis nigricans TaxID=341454 RepID=A0A4S2MWH8_9PEZI|nr:hypothetical protein EX30DRAFT_32658 [Ascodesmis nigricans]